MIEPLVVAAIAVMGFALQRGTVCAVLAARELVEHGRWQRLLAFPLASAVVAGRGRVAARRQAAANALVDGRLGDDRGCDPVRDRRDLE